MGEVMWTGKDLTILNAVLDEIIPPSEDGKIPGAGAIGVVNFLPGATTFASDPAGSVNAILFAIAATKKDFLALDRDGRVELLKAVEVKHPTEFAELVRLIYMGYYSRPDMRPHFGVGAHPIHPEGYEVERESDQLMQELTEPVRARGRAYRIVPNEDGALAI